MILKALDTVDESCASDGFRASRQVLGLSKGVEIPHVMSLWETGVLSPGPITTQAQDH